MMRPINDEEVLHDLDRRSKKWGNSARMALEFGVNPSHLREIKSGRRPLNTKVAGCLGWDLRWVKRTPLCGSDHAAEVARLVMVLRALRDVRHIPSFVGAQLIANAVLADYPEVKA